MRRTEPGLIPALSVLALLLCLAGCAGEASAPETAAPAEETAVVTPAAAAALSPTPAPTPSPEPETATQAELLDLRVSAGGTPQRWATVEPEKDNAAFRLWAGETMVVESDVGPITQLYIKWDSPPGEWALRCGEREYVCGQQGFLHEYIALPEPCESLTVTLRSGWCYVCSVSAFTPGTLPDWVQVWEPPWERADLLIVSTHNDDDILYFGGAEPYYAGELSRAVQVVYLTQHWSQRERTHEALNGLWTMGVTHYPVIGGFGDVASASLQQARLDYDSRYVTAYLTEQIRRFRPAVILGQAEDGEYGHGAHQLCVDCLKQAVELAADETQYPASAALWGVWDTPKLYLHLYGPAEERTVMDWDVPLTAFGGLTAFQVAEQAYACHVSQHPDRRFFVYPRDNIYTCYEFGLYRSLAGADTAKNDLFEHLDGFTGVETHG